MTIILVSLMTILQGVTEDLPVTMLHVGKGLSRNTAYTMEPSACCMSQSWARLHSRSSRCSDMGLYDLLAGGVRLVSTAGSLEASVYQRSRGKVMASALLRMSSQTRPGSPS